MISIYYLQFKNTQPLQDVIERINELGLPIDISQIVTYKNPKIQFTKLIGRYILFLILQKQFAIHPDDFSFSYTKHGKPYLIKRPDIHFNISHSGDYIIWAVAEQPIGIDIERITKARMQVAKRYFSLHELQELEKSTPGINQDTLFTHLWSAKESYLKFTGIGITEGLNSFTVHLNKEGGYIEQHQRILPLQLYSLTQIEHYACYLTYEMNIPTIIRTTQLQEIPLNSDLLE